jgi:hypothetical protein
LRLFSAGKRATDRTLALSLEYLEALITVA